jgi:hypothetical protein
MSVLGVGGSAQQTRKGERRILLKLGCALSNFTIADTNLYKNFIDCESISKIS